MAQSPTTQQLLDLTPPRQIDTEVANWLLRNFQILADEIDKVKDRLDALEP